MLNRSSTFNKTGISRQTRQPAAEPAHKSSERAREAIEAQLRSQNIVRRCDVSDLYLPNMDLDQVCDLSEFRNLRRVWLNENRLRFVPFLQHNFRLSELHLADNSIVSIRGAIAHLTGLKKLSLNNNQLSRLEETVSEIRFMQALHYLNLCHNPLTSEPQYRSYVIHHMPQVAVLDQSSVREDERLKAKRTFAQERMRLEDAVGFGRFLGEKPLLDQVETGLVKPLQRDIANHFNRPPLGDPERAAARRANQRSVMEYTRFDWSSVPTEEQKRLHAAFGDAHQPAFEPQIITVRFQ